MSSFKVIPLKKKLSNDFLKTFPEYSLLNPVLKTTIEKISHRACLRDVMIDACTDTNHARYFIGSGYILR